MNAMSPSMYGSTGGTLISKTMGTAGNMMGAVVPAAYGAEVLSMVKRNTKRMRRRRR